jgi:hypothetical protein
MTNNSKQPAGAADSGLLSDDDLDLVVGGFGPIIPNPTMGQGPSNQ